jgi:hypothetical protein
MQILRRALTFWVTCVLVVACISAFDTFVLRRIESDFGGPFGNFAIVVGLYALLALPAALGHGGAAFLLRKQLTKVSATGLLVASALSAVAFLLLLNPTESISRDLPLRPLLLPCAIAFALSFVVLGAAAKVPIRYQAGAA